MRFVRASLRGVDGPRAPASLARACLARSSTFRVARVPGSAEQGQSPGSARPGARGPSGGRSELGDLLDLTDGGCLAGAREGGGPGGGESSALEARVLSDGIGARPKSGCPWGEGKGRAGEAPRRTSTLRRHPSQETRKGFRNDAPAFGNISELRRDGKTRNSECTPTSRHLISHDLQCPRCSHTWNPCHIDRNGDSKCRRQECLHTKVRVRFVLVHVRSSSSSSSSLFWPRSMSLAWEAGRGRYGALAIRSYRQGSCQSAPSESVPLLQYLVSFALHSALSSLPPPFLSPHTATISNRSAIVFACSSAKPSTSTCTLTYHTLIAALIINFAPARGNTLTTYIHRAQDATHHGQSVWPLPDPQHLASLSPRAVQAPRPAGQSALCARLIVYICICVYIYIYIYTHREIYVYMSLSLSIYIYIYIYICVYICMYVCMCICGYIYIYIYTQRSLRAEPLLFQEPALISNYCCLYSILTL